MPSSEVRKCTKREVRWLRLTGHIAYWSLESSQWGWACSNMSIATICNTRTQIFCIIYIYKQSIICNLLCKCSMLSNCNYSLFEVSSPKKSLRSFSPHFRSCILWLQLPQLPPPVVTERNESMSNAKVPNHFRFDIPWPRILKSLRFVAHRHRCPNPMPGFFEDGKWFQRWGLVGRFKILNQCVLYTSYIRLINIYRHILKSIYTKTHGYIYIYTVYISLSEVFKHLQIDGEMLIDLIKGKKHMTMVSKEKSSHQHVGNIWKYLYVYLTLTCKSAGPALWSPSIHANIKSRPSQIAYVLMGRGSLTIVPKSSKIHTARVVKEPKYSRLLDFLSQPWMTTNHLLPCSMSGLDQGPFQSRWYWRSLANDDHASRGCIKRGAMAHSPGKVLWLCPSKGTSHEKQVLQMVY